MQLKLEQPFTPTKTLSEQTKRVCELIDVTDIVERFPADTTDYLINTIIDVSLQVWADARENPQISPKARRIQKEELFEKYCIELNLDIVKEVFIDDSVQALGKNVDDDLITRRKKVAEDFAENVEDIIQSKINSLMQTAERLGKADSGTVEYRDIAQALLSFGVKIDVPESSDSSPKHAVQESSEQIKIRMNFVPSRGTVIKLVASTALAATVVGVGATSAAAAERPSVSKSSSSSSNPDNSIPPVTSASPSTETQSAEVQPVIEAEPSTTMPATPSTEAPINPPTDTTAQPDTPPSTTTQDTPTTPPVEVVVVPVQQPETAPPTTVFTQLDALPIDTPISEATATVQQDNSSNETSKAANNELSDSAARLIPEMADVPNKLVAALKDGNITGFGKDTAFNQKDPANTDKLLQMIINAEQRTALKVHADDINKVLSGDKETIDRLLKYYSTQDIDQDTFGKIADYIVTLRFVKDDGPDLSIEQKIIIVRLYASVHDELSAEAEALYEKAVKDYEANKPKEVKPPPLDISGSAGIDSKTLAKIKDYVEAEVSTIPHRSKEQQDFLVNMIISTELIKATHKAPNFNESVADAQMVVESGWAQSELASKYNNYFGVKAGSSWKGKTVLMPTWEQDLDGTRHKIMAKFRWYDSLEDSLADRLVRLGSLKHFKDASNCYESVDTYIDGLLNLLDENCKIVVPHENPYATSLTYKETLKSVIKANHLEEIYARIEIINKSADKPVQTPKGLNKAETRAVKGLSEVGLDTGDITIQKKKSGGNMILINKTAAVKKLGLEPYGTYPEKLRDLPLDAVGTQYGMYSRECVDYVAWRVDHDKKGIGMPRWGGRISEGYGGVAYRWNPNSVSDGIKVDLNPTVGSVMAWNANGKDHKLFGHVAYVEAVLSDGSVIVSQYNNGGTGQYTVELITKQYIDSHDTVRFDHFEQGSNDQLPDSTRPHDDSY